MQIRGREGKHQGVPLGPDAGGRVGKRQGHPLKGALLGVPAREGGRVGKRKDPGAKAEGPGCERGRARVRKG